MAVLTDPGERVDAPIRNLCTDGSFLDHPEPPFEMIYQTRSRSARASCRPSFSTGIRFVDYYVSAGFSFS